MSESKDSGSDRVPPLNLTAKEAAYLWEMVQEEIGKTGVWEGGHSETVGSLHTKIGEVVGAFEDGADRSLDTDS